jgi:hypothetical protein
MSKQKLTELAALIADNSNSDSEYISKIFNEAVFQRIKEKLKERNEFVYATIKDIELSESILIEAESEETPPEDESDEEPADGESDEEPTESEFPSTEFDPETTKVISLITLNTDIDGLSDEDKDFITQYLNGELSDEDKQTLLSSIYGDGEWASDMDSESLEDIEDSEIFENAEAFSTPTEGVSIILTIDEENNEIVVFASKSESDVETKESE